MKPAFGIGDWGLAGAGVRRLRVIAQGIEARGLRAFTNPESRIPNLVASGAGE